jgi:hypothetical protein
MLSFKSHTIHIRLYTDKVIIRQLEKDVTIERTSDVPFSNARMVLANFKSADIFIRGILDEIYAGQRLAPSIKILIQPMEKLEGGISQVEDRSFSDLGMQLGGKSVFIHSTQEDLDDAGIKELTK